MILEARGVTKRFGGVTALDGVSLGVRAGEVLGIMGPNGSGKTTLFNILTGIESPSAGDVLLDGRVVTGIRPHRIARQGVARTFQNLRLFPGMTTTENVLCGAHHRENGSMLRALLPSRARARREAAERAAAEALLREVGLGDRIGVYAAALSYGQTKRLELARALNMQPRVLLLDEPTAGMNDAQAAELLALVRRLHRTHGLTLVVIEHNVPALVWLADRIVVLDSGRVLVDAAPEQAASDPRVIEAYLGRGRGGMTLAVEGLVAGYGARTVLHGLSVAVAAGEAVALIGHNGTGKSTLLRCLSGQIVPTAGRIRFDGASIAGVSPSRIVRLGIVQVPAGRRVFPRLSVRENLEAGAFTRSNRGEAAQDLGRMMERFPVLGRKQRVAAGVLSGGEQQLLAIARGLMARPRLLMVDEPSLGLSPVMVDEVFDVLGDLVRGGMALVLAEQNVRKALQVTHRAYVLAQGRVAAEGASATLLDDAEIRRSYLGLGQAASFGALVDAADLAAGV